MLLHCRKGRGNPGDHVEHDLASNPPSARNSPRTHTWETKTMVSDCISLPGIRREGLPRTGWGSGIRWSVMAGFVELANF